MKQAEFASLLDKIQEQEREVRKAGQAEYAREADNCFANFDRIGKMLNLPREKVLWIYLFKHIDGIVAHINGHKSQREDVRGRIKDARLYLALLWGMLDDSEVASGDDSAQLSLPLFHGAEEPAGHYELSGPRFTDIVSAPEQQVEKVALPTLAEAFSMGVAECDRNPPYFRAGCWTMDGFRNPFTSDTRQNLSWHRGYVDRAERTGYGSNFVINKQR